MKLLWAAVALFTLGCGVDPARKLDGGDDTESCVSCGAGGFGCDTMTVGICVDYSAGTAAEMATCTTSLSGTVVAACDLSAAVGGCETTMAGVTVTIWSYPPITASQARSSCASGTFVDP